MKKTTFYYYNGKTYTKAHRLAQDTGLAVEEVERLMDEEDRDALPGIEFRDYIEFEGETFSSLRQLARHLGANQATLLLHIRTEGQVEAGVETYRNKQVSTKVVVKGVEYPTKGAALEAFGLSYYSVANYTKDNKHTLEEAIDLALEPKESGVEYEGKTYRSMRMLCAEKGVSDVIVRLRLGLGWSLKRAIEEPVATNGPKHPCKFRGVVYNSKNDMCMDYKISYSLVDIVVASNNATWEVAFCALLELREKYLAEFLDTDTVLLQVPMGIYNGKLYMELESLLNDVNVSVHAYSVSRMQLSTKYGKGLSVFEVLSIMKRMTHPRYEYKGKIMTYTELEKSADETIHMLLQTNKARKMERPVHPDCEYYDSKNPVDLRKHLEDLVVEWKKKERENSEELPIQLENNYADA